MWNIFKKNSKLNENNIPDVPFPKKFQEVETWFNFKEYVKKNNDYISKLKKLLQINFNKIDKVKKEKEEYEETISKLNDTISGLSNQNSNYHNNWDNLNKKLSKFDEPLKDDLKSIKSYFDNYFKKNNLNNDLLDKLYLLINRVNLSENELELEKERITNYNSNLNILKKELNNKDQEFEELKKKFKDNNKENNLWSLSLDPNHIQILENKISLLDSNNQSLIVENDNLKENLSISYNKVKELEKKIDKLNYEYKDKFKTFLNKKKIYEDKIENWKSEKLKFNIENNLIKNKNIEKDRENKKLKEDLDSLSNLKNEINKLKIENDLKSQEITSKIEEIDTIQAKIKDLSTKNNEMKQYLNNLKNKESLEKNHNRIQKVLKYFKTITSYTNQIKEKIIDLFLNLDKDKLTEIDKINNELKALLMEINIYLTKIK